MDSGMEPLKLLQLKSLFNNKNIINMFLINYILYFILYNIVLLYNKKYLQIC